MGDDLYELAPPGRVYVCAACGKQSRNRAGWLKDTNERVAISDGWDSSCMLHAVLCYDRPSNNPNYRWEAVRDDDDGR